MKMSKLKDIDSYNTNSDGETRPILKETLNFIVLI